MIGIFIFNWIFLLILMIVKQYSISSLLPQPRVNNHYKIDLFPWKVKNVVLPLKNLVNSWWWLCNFSLAPTNEWYYSDTNVTMLKRYISFCTPFNLQVFKNRLPVIEFAFNIYYGVLYKTYVNTRCGTKLKYLPNQYIFEF